MYNNAGFRKKTLYLSSLSAMLGTWQILYQAWDSNFSSRIIFLDISQAFDRVEHTSLILRLQQLGNVGSFSNNLTSCLYKRSEVIFMNNTLTYLNSTKFVFCASRIFFSNLLFLIYPHYMALLRTLKDLQRCLFADETTLFHSTKCPVHLHRVLSQDRCALRKLSFMTESNYTRGQHPLLFNTTYLSYTQILEVAFPLQSFLAHAHFACTSENNDQN